MAEDISVTDRVKQSFSALSSVASILNASSDKLSSNIASLEAELKKLSLGVSSFVIFEDRVPRHSLFYDFDKLRYSKVNGKWGFVIETLAGHEEADDHRVHEIWPFNEAPRGKRVKAVDFIPELLDKLAKDATTMVEEVDQRCEAVAKIAEAISPAKPAESIFQTKLREAFQKPDPALGDEMQPVDTPAGELTRKAREFVTANETPRLPTRPLGGKRK